MLQSSNDPLDGIRWKVAGPVLTWFFDKTGFCGVTLPWKVVYLHYQYASDMWLRRHEAAHIKQIERDGAWVWSFFIVLYLIFYGYNQSPYEIEARKAEHDEFPSTKTTGLRLNAADHFYTPPRSGSSNAGGDAL